MLIKDAFSGNTGLYVISFFKDIMMRILTYAQKTFNLFLPVSEPVIALPCKSVECFADLF